MAETPLERLARLCAGCGHCCRELVVPVTDADVRRLARATGRAPGSFVRLYGTVHCEFDEDDPTIADLAAGRRFLGLRKAEGRCVFLDRDNRCTVYPHRPRTCRTFPFDVRFDDRGNVRRVSRIPCGECGYQVGDARHFAGLPDEARREAAEDAAYRRRIARWNARGTRGTKAEFLEFLGLDAPHRSAE